MDINWLMNKPHLYNKMLSNKKKYNTIYAATICMNLKNIRLSERSLSQKIKYYMIEFI